MTLAAAAPAPPLAKGWPLVGHLPHLARDVLGYMEHLGHLHGDVVRLSVGPREVWVVRHPRDVEFVHLQTGRLFDKGLGKDPVLHALLGNGLLLSENDFWLRQRRLAQPAFHAGRIAAYADIMAQEARRTLSTWRAGEVRDVHADMTGLTLNIVAKCLLDTDPGTGTNETVAQAVDSVLTEYRRGLGNPLYRSSAFSQRRVRRAIARINAVVQGIIDERRADGRDRGDLLSMLLAARDDDGQGMTDAQLLDEVKNIFLAGHDTTASTLTFALALLAQHPGAESRLHAELREVLNDRPPELADLRRLPFLEAVVKETLRLYPAAWSTQRQATQDVQIGGYDAKKGTVVWVNHWVTQRDERFFEAPGAFRPERWLGNLERELPKFAYFPFGGGGRVCIGRDFARMEAMLILGTLAQAFRPRLVRPLKLEPAISLRPKGAVPMTLHARR